MGQFIVGNIKWKKGERGKQLFILFESDGVTRRNGTGFDYEFKFWKKGASATKGGGSLIAIDAVNGEYEYILTATDTDTVDDYLGEIIEDPNNSKARSETFDVDVEESSDLS